MTDLVSRFDNLDRMIAEGRVIRKAWTEGQERACLLAAISPEAGAAESSSKCPADVIPEWLAHLTPNMDDKGTIEAWPAFIRRYADVVRRGALMLDAEGWRRAMFGALHCIIREAMSHTDDKAVLGICETVVGLIARGRDGNEPAEKEWQESSNAAARAANAAATTANAAVGYAAYAAAYAADAADAADAAYAAAYYAAEAAANAAYAWDRMNTGILDAIEAQVVRKERAGEVKQA